MLLPSIKAVITPDRQAMQDIVDLAGAAGLVLVCPMGSRQDAAKTAIVHHQRIPEGWEVLNIEKRDANEQT